MKNKIIGIILLILVLAGCFKFDSDEKSKEEKVKNYDEVIKLEPNRKKVYYNRGNLKYDLGDYEGSIKDYDKGIELDPNYKEAYFNRGGAKYSSGDYKESIKDYDKAIELDPNYKEAYFYRGGAKYRSGDYKESIKDYDKAIELGLNYKEAYFYRGSAKYRSGDYKGSIKDFKEAIKKKWPIKKDMINYEISYFTIILLCCYIVGISFGYTMKKNTFIIKFIFFACLIALIFSTRVNLAVESYPKIPYLLTGLIWVGFGYMLGRKVSNYWLAVGPYGLLFTIIIAILITAFGQIIHDFIALQFNLPFGFDGPTEKFKFAIALHFCIMFNALFWVWPFYKLYKKYLNRFIIERVVGVATILGILRFAIQYIESSIQKNALWWIPGEQVPIEFEILISYSMGVFLAFPVLGYTFQQLAYKINKNPKVGLTDAVIRMDGTFIDTKEHNFKLREGISYKVNLPEGWEELEQQIGENRITQSFLPPVEARSFWQLILWNRIIILWNRITQSSLPLVKGYKLYFYLDPFAPDEVKKRCSDEIINNSADPIFDPKRHSELLGRAVAKNLIWKGASIESEQYDILSGIPSYECTFKRPLSHIGVLYSSGYVANFIVENWECTFYWEADFEVFNDYLDDVKKIVRGTTLILNTDKELN